jgi:hypothetical protein
MNQYAIDGLRAKLAEVNGAIRATNQRLRVLAMDRDVLARALVIMGSDPGEGTVSLGIAAGAFARTILDVIRPANQPLSVREIAEALAPRAGKPLDKREMAMLVARVRNAMPRLSDRLDGELRDRTTFWRVKPDVGQ